MCLELEGHQVSAAGTIDDALEQTARQAFDLIFLDLRLGLQNGLDFIPQLLSENPWTRIIVITAYASVETAVEAMKRGASDYLPKPFEAAQVIHVTQKVAERRQLERKVQALQAAMGAMDAEAELTAADPAMVAALGPRPPGGTKPGESGRIQGEIGSGKGKIRAGHSCLERSVHPAVCGRHLPVRLDRCGSKPSCLPLPPARSGILRRWHPGAGRGQRIAHAATAADPSAAKRSRVRTAG